MCIVPERFDHLIYMTDVAENKSRTKNAKRKTEGAATGQRRAKKAKGNREPSPPDEQLLLAYPSRCILMFNSNSKDA